MRLSTGQQTRAARNHSRNALAQPGQRQQPYRTLGASVRTSGVRVAAVPYGAGGDGSSTLAAHQFWLQRQRVLHHEPHPSDADIIELNCGGSIMVTSRSTLRQVQGSLLCLLFDPANNHLLRHDASGRVFLDHDPAAFGLLLRHLRELRAAAGYACGPVLLPAIPPADAPSFRALNTHLGLGIPEEDIAAAVRRGAALAATAAAATASLPHLPAAGHDRPPGSPYASRPAPPGTLEQQQQQQWLRQQWQQQCSPGGGQQQQQEPPVDPASPQVASMGRSSASGISSPVAQGDVEGSGWQPSAADWDALTSPPAAGQQQQLQASWHPDIAAQHQGSAAVSGGMSLSGQQQPESQRQHLAVGSIAQDDNTVFAAGAGAAAADGVDADAATEYSTPTVQDFYMLTSPAGGTDGSTGSSSSMFGNPLRVSVLTEGDALALQHMQQQRGQSSSSSRGYFAEPDEASALSFDVFCSTSSSKGLMSLSLVVRESAGLDNVFVGVTTSNQADQRGLQIPSFGWHQVSSSMDGDTSPITEYDSHNDGCLVQQQEQQQQRWGSGDLVQLMLQRGSSNSVTLKVNNEDSMVPDCGDYGSSSNSASSVRLPAFQRWCWYLAFYRGTQVVAVVLEPSSYSVYSGDTKLKRFMS